MYRHIELSVINIEAESNSMTAYNPKYKEKKAEGRTDT